MSLIVSIYPSTEKGDYGKSKRNLRLRLDRFCETHKDIVRAKIIGSREMKSKILRNWFPLGHILLIHDSDYEKWTKLIKKKFEEYNPKIEQIVKL